MRQAALAVSSLTLVFLAGAAVFDAALAQDVQVSYHTDPGPAHPRYANEPAEMVTATAAPSATVQATQVVQGRAAATAQPQRLSYDDAPYQRDAIHEISTRRSVVVHTGDTVYALARRYNVSPDMIISVNRLSAPYTLRVGQELNIPATSPASSSSPIAVPQPIVQAQAPTPIAVSSTTMSTPTPTTAPAMVSTSSRDGLYTVRQGDTLYSLSRRFGVELSALASVNRLAAPYALTIDQRLIIPGAITAAPAPITSTTTTAIPAPAPTYTDVPAPMPLAPTPITEPDVEPILVSRSPGSRFSWPLRGAVIMEYGTSADGVRNDGINIAAPIGALVRAAADGEVVYTGSELAGYGNLLLVRHDDDWVSAYAHTDDILVERGDWIRQGQVIAKVGRTGSVDQPQLHFELRHELQPRDPMAALNGTDVQAAAYSR